MSSCRVMPRLLWLALNIVAVTAGAAQAAGPAATTAAATMKPGVWEISQLIETPGVNSRRTVVSLSCFSADDVRSPAAVLPRQHEPPPMKCDNRDIKARNGKLDWRIVCAGEHGASMNGSAEMTLAADSYKAEAKLDSRAGAKATKVQQTINGKWVAADCKQ